MAGEYMVLHFLLWSTTVGFLSLLDVIAKKRLGVKSQNFINLRLPKFISLVITSVTTIIAMYVLNNNLIEAKMADHLAIPYFAVTSYFIVAFFRQMKKVDTTSSKKRVGYYYGK